eukprot:m.69700 g.69700  ORF g.69700 m.69700 type:complete len:238 (-) comp8280_c0_seq2:385-1098(-)
MICKGVGCVGWSLGKHLWKGSTFSSTLSSSSAVSIGSRNCYLLFARLRCGQILRQGRTLYCSSTGFEHEKRRLFHTSTRGLAPRMDYYKMLGISSTATQKEIKTAYYRKSLLHHPDKHQGDLDAAKKFGLLTKAYSILSQPDLRREYDAGKPTGYDRQGPRMRNQRRAGPMNYHNAHFDFQAYFRGHYGDSTKRMKQRKNREEMQKRIQVVIEQSGSSSTMLFVLCAGVVWYMLRWA